MEEAGAACLEVLKTKFAKIILNNGTQTYLDPHLEMQGRTLAFRHGFYLIHS